MAGQRTDLVVDLVPILDRFRNGLVPALLLVVRRSHHAASTSDSTTTTSSSFRRFVAVAATACDFLRRRDDDAALALGVGFAVAVAADVVGVCDTRAAFGGLAERVVHVVAFGVGLAVGRGEEFGGVFLQDGFHGGHRAADYTEV